jgi:ABC-2 type transport system ATP-binding protein
MTRLRDAAVQAEGIVKRFGSTWALRGVDLAVPRGSVLGLLGPNGAGKTTMVRILTTLLKPDAGRAQVAGFDVVGQAQEVRYRIGLTGQQAAVDEYLTGRGNLEMVGRLYHMSPKAARERAEELLERFDLTEAGGRIAKTYSGGMRRRLDLAAGLVASPPVLFLDEPTTGLDPRSRVEMWNVIGELVDGGTTLLLTTQYLDEADRLADQIVVIDSGRAVATGTPAELKRSVGGERVDVQVREIGQLAAAQEAILKATGREPRLESEVRRLTVPTEEGAAALIAVVREFDAAKVGIEDIALRSPTLDEVFMKLTGHAAEEAETSEAFAKEKEAA